MYENVYWLYDAALNAAGNKVTVTAYKDSDSYEMSTTMYKIFGATSLWININKIIEKEFSDFCTALQKVALSLGLTAAECGIDDYKRTRNSFIPAITDEQMNKSESELNLEFHSLLRQHFSKGTNLFDTMFITNEGRYDYIDRDPSLMVSKIRWYLTRDNDLLKACLNFQEDRVKSYLKYNKYEPALRQIFQKAAGGEREHTVSDFSFAFGSIIADRYKMNEEYIYRGANAPESGMWRHITLERDDVDVKTKVPGHKYIQFQATISPLQLNATNQWTSGGVKGFITSAVDSTVDNGLATAVNAAGAGLADAEKIGEVFGAGDTMRNSEFMKWVKKLTNQRYRSTTSDVLSWEATQIAVPVSISRTFVQDQWDLDLDSELLAISELAVGECLPLSELLSSNNTDAKEAHKNTIEEIWRKRSEDIRNATETRLTNIYGGDYKGKLGANYTTKYNMIMDEETKKLNEDNNSWGRGTMAGLGKFINLASGGVINRPPLNYRYNSTNYLRGLKSNAIEGLNINNDTKFDVKSGDEWPGTLSVLYPSGLKLGGLVIYSVSMEYSHVMVMTKRGLRPITVTVHLSVQPARVWTQNDFNRIIKHQTVQ